MTARPIAWLTLLLVLSSSCGAADPSHTCPANQPLLVVVPDLLMGITNQLMTAINGIFLGIESKRNICLGGFYGHVYSEPISKKIWFGQGKTEPPPLIDAHRILSIQHLRDVFRDDLNGLTICSCSPHAVTNATCVITNGIHDGGGFCKVRRNLLPSLDIAEYVTPKQFLLQPVKTVVLAPPVTNMTRIIIGCPWQLFSNDYEINMKSDARVTYFASLRFADSFYEVFKALTQIYIRKARSSVPAYSAVHFRIEDDFIRHKHFKMNKLESYYFLFLYIKLIRTKVPNRKEPIFLQTGLRPADSLYFGLKYLKHFFPNAIVLDKAAFIARLPDAKLRAPPVHPGGVSQIRAIFDMISAQSSRVFIGSRESTFSWWCAHSKTPLGSVVKDGAAPSVFLINRKEAIANKTAIALFENSSGYLMLKSFVPLK